MAKFNPYTQRPKTRTHKTITVQDEGGDITLTFWRATTPENYKAVSDAEDFFARFVGDEENPATEGLPPLLGGWPDLSRTLLQQCALMQVMQPPFVKGDDRHSLLDLVAISCTASSASWNAVSRFWDEMSGEKAANPPTVGTEASCGPVSTSSASTPNTSPELTPCSVPSTSAYGEIPV